MGKCSRKLALLSLLLLWSNFAVSAQTDTPEENIQTRQGELKVDGWQLRLNGKVIYASKTDAVIIWKYFEKKSVVLLNDGLRSSECSGKFRFITLKDDGSVTISQEIGNCTIPEIREDNDKITLKFPAWYHPGATWTYVNGRLTKTGQEYAVTPGVWQTSMEAKPDYIDLGIRDKHGDAHQGVRYTAWFVVTGPDGRIYKAHKTVRESASGYVRFPRDFGKKVQPLQNGTYLWKCVVEGGEVAGGRFTYTVTGRPAGFKAVHNFQTDTAD